MDRVLVAVDDSAESREAMHYALDQFPDADLRVIHVPEVKNPGTDPNDDSATAAQREGEELLSEMEALAAEHDRHVETDLVFGNVGKTILSEAEEYDADGIVVGSTGRTGARRVLLGSVAEMVVRRADCPVTVAR